MLIPKPCPFCGNAPIIEPKNPEKEGNAWGLVKCVADECPANPSVNDGEIIADGRGSDEYIRAAVKRWNKRAVTITYKKEIDELRGC